MLDLIQEPTWVLTCDHNDCDARGPEAATEEGACDAAEALGWVTDADDRDWCPAHAHLARRAVCVCRIPGHGPPAVECSKECTERRLLRLRMCTRCNRAIALRPYVECTDGTVIHASCVHGVPS